MGKEMALILLGDLMLGRNVDKDLSRSGVRQIWGNCLPLLTGGLAEQQVLAANLDCTSKHGTEGWIALCD